MKRSRGYYKKRKGALTTWKKRYLERKRDTYLKLKRALMGYLKK